MTPEDFETYRFLRLYTIDFDTALHTLKVLCRYKKPDVQYPLLREVAVAYSRPFSKNHGEHLVSHMLSTKHVPTAAKPLHLELLRLRNQQFAHTDIKFYAPKVADFGIAAKASFPMSFKSYDYSQLLARVPEIQSLIEAVVVSLNKDITREERRF